MVVGLLLLGGCGTGSQATTRAGTSAGASDATGRAVAPPSGTVTEGAPVPHALPDGLADRLTARLRTMAGAAATVEEPAFTVEGWTSQDDFWVHAVFTLHFDGASTGPWNEGVNERFVHLVRATDGSYHEQRWTSSL